MAEGRRSFQSKDEENRRSFQSKDEEKGAGEVSVSWPGGNGVIGIMRSTTTQIYTSTIFSSCLGHHYHSKLRSCCYRNSHSPVLSHSNN